MGDAWKESLERSRDIPHLYGDNVIKNGFVLFLQHIFHSQQKEFPALLGRFLADFSLGISCVLPVDETETGLVLPGYSDKEIGHAFSHIHPKGKNIPASRDNCYRD